MTERPVSMGFGVIPQMLDFERAGEGDTNLALMTRTHSAYWPPCWVGVGMHSDAHGSRDNEYANE